jgi:hypothetical protein
MSDLSTPQDSAAMSSASAGSVAGRITAYLVSGGLFNPEQAIHDRVRDLLIDCRDEIERRRLTASERAAIRFAAGEAAAIAEQNPTSKFWPDHAVCLRSAAERLG